MECLINLVNKTDLTEKIFSHFHGMLKKGKKIAVHILYGLQAYCTWQTHNPFLYQTLKKILNSELTSRNNSSGPYRIA